MISVIIPAHNAAATITECLEALARQTLPCDQYEVIVVDDGSVDETAELVRATPVKLICHERSRGAAAARNSGLRAAQGSIICFTDADCAPAPDWIAQIAAPLCQDPETIGSKGVYGSHQRQLVARFVQIEYEDKYDLLHGQEQIDFIDTYSAAYRRDVLLANNGFDENVFYVEDQELSFRLAARGYKMVFQPQARVYHRHSDTLLKYGRKKFQIGYWKAQIIRRFPNRAVKDSHTPQVLKLQMLLMALLLVSFTLPLLAGWLWPAAIWWTTVLPLAVAGTYLLTTVPFCRKAWGKDRAVALAAPGLLALRALALGFGYGWGLLRPQKEISDRAENTIGGLNYIGKRLLDVGGGLLGLGLTAVIGLPVALAIRLDSAGPVIFKQERVGQDGRPFIVYKFRSMKVGAESELDSLLDLNELAQPAFKLKDDPRLTRVGRFLRRWSLDELPQFWNVLRGEMSLIGPRPEESRLVARYNDWHRRRLAVKPGITGPMQVNGRGDLPLDERVRLELDYIENYSLWRDLVILAQTIPAVIRGTGAR
jgi:lipopolysaccharide/colanic/teichoic acid biosynthesis glycosyltransferase/glycosyltransferase involved in cell wall biosynthesis